MIKIEHVALYCKNLEESREFYEKYFGAKSNNLYVNKKGFSSYFLTFEGGARLELMSHEQLIERSVIDKSTGWSHVAFSVGSREEVIRLTNQLIEDGYLIYSNVRETGDGYFESCISDPFGNRVEITV